MGYYGHAIYDDESSIPEGEVYVGIEAFGEAASVTYNLYLPQSNTSTPITATIPDGRIIYGRISGLEIVSGTVLVYYLQ